MMMTGDFVGHDNEFQSHERNIGRMKEFTDFSEDMASGMKIFPAMGNHVSYSFD
jgi:hypothetical protein